MNFNGAMKWVTVIYTDQFRDIKRLQDIIVGLRKDNT